MRYTIKALAAAAIATGVMLFLAPIALDWWDARALRESQGTENPSVVESPYALVDPPPPTGSAAIAYGVLKLTALCILGAIWAAVIVLPAILGARRLLNHPLGSRVLAFAVVGVLSAVAYASQLSPRGPWSPILVFAVGGVMGLASAGVVDRMLPPRS